VSRRQIGAPARCVAARALSDVLDSGRSLTDALSGLDAALDATRDRAFVRRLCNRILRALPALEWRLSRLLGKPLPRHAREVHFLLLCAIDQLIEGREPAPAVVHATVAATRTAGHPHLAGMVNAVLRNHQRRAEELSRLPDRAPIRFGYPDWLLDRIRADWPDCWKAVAAAGNQPPPTWLRVNRRRAGVGEILERLAESEIEGHVDARLPDAIRLDRSAAVTTLPGFSEGLVSIQDAGAQTAARLLDLEDGQRVLDACAAPGGKSAHILETADVELTAIDNDATRLPRIEENLRRLGLTGRIALGDASTGADFAAGARYDRILIDAPCSATGVMRRHPDVRWLRRADDIDRNTTTQRRILETLWPRLEPGGLLVYASCSILRAENCEQIRAFIERNADARAIEFDIIDSVATDPGHQILPGSLDRDGFFYAGLRRLR
jgi:16S rRNA (cytosine967-C5)-methyltransferase